jgi:hypothetical protein
MIALIENDLLAEISKKELDGLSKKLIEAGQPDPVATAIAESIDLIRDYIDPWKLREGTLRRLWRILAVCGIYNRLATLPEKREKQKAAVIKMLEDIRDGKFQHLLIDEETLPPDGAGKWSSDKKFKPR